MVIGEDIPFSAHDKPGPYTLLFEPSGRIALRKGAEEVSEGILISKGIAREIAESNVLYFLDHLDIDHPGTNLFGKVAEVCRDHGGLGNGGSC